MSLDHFVELVGLRRELAAWHKIAESVGFVNEPYTGSVVVDDAAREAFAEWVVRVRRAESDAFERTVERDAALTKLDNERESWDREAVVLTQRAESIAHDHAKTLAERDEALDERQAMSLALACVARDREVDQAQLKEAARVRAKLDDGIAVVSSCAALSWAAQTNMDAAHAWEKVASEWLAGVDERGEIDQLRTENAQLREALVPFAAMPDGLLSDPHPCSVRCWRVGGPCNTSGGVCEECGRRSSRDEEYIGRVTYGDVRRARAALAKGGA